VGVSALTGLACVGCLGWAAAYEVRSFRLRRVEVPVLAPGWRPLRVLQVSVVLFTTGLRATR
jgi:hypothetical protein